MNLVLIIIANPVSDPTAGTVNNDIGLVFSGQTFGLADGCALFSVFAGDTLVPFTEYRPAVFIGHHMLVPGTAAFATLCTIQKDFDEVYKGS